MRMCGATYFNRIPVRLRGPPMRIAPRWNNISPKEEDSSRSKSPPSKPPPQPPLHESTTTLHGEEVQSAAQPDAAAKERPQRPAPRRPIGYQNSLFRRSLTAPNLTLRPAVQTEEKNTEAWQPGNHVEQKQVLETSISGSGLLAPTHRPPQPTKQCTSAPSDKEEGVGASFSGVDVDKLVQQAFELITPIRDVDSPDIDPSKRERSRTALHFDSRPATGVPSPSVAVGISSPARSVAATGRGSTFGPSTSDAWARQSTIPSTTNTTTIFTNSSTVAASDEAGNVVKSTGEGPSFANEISRPAPKRSLRRSSSLRGLSGSGGPCRFANNSASSAGPAISTAGSAVPPSSSRSGLQVPSKAAPRAPVSTSGGGATRTPTRKAPSRVSMTRARAPLRSGFESQFRPEDILDEELQGQLPSAPPFCHT